MKMQGRYLVACYGFGKELVLGCELSELSNGVTQAT